MIRPFYQTLHVSVYLRPIQEIEGLSEEENWSTQASMHGADFREPNATAIDACLYQIPIRSDVTFDVCIHCHMLLSFCLKQPSCLINLVTRAA